MTATTATASSADPYRGTPSRQKLLEIARYFLFIGLVGFGGPLVHIAMMESDLVGEDSREWTDESTFMEGLAICNTLPGPASTQLGIFMGWIYAGNLGAVVAGFFFMLPTFVIVVFFSWLYFAYQAVPSVEALFYGINPVVIGLIVGASWSMARSALAEGRADTEFRLGAETWSIDYLLVGLLAAALVVTATIGTNPVVQFVVAGAIAVGIYRSTWVRRNWRRVSVWSIVALVVGVAFAVRDRLFDLLGPATRRTIEASPLWGLLLAIWANPWVQLFTFMIYTGSFIYGGGLVLIPFIELYVVNEFGWMTGREFVDGIAIGQLSPGPVVMTTAFVGYKLMLDTYGLVSVAVVGAFVAMVGAFGPSFAFIMGFFPYFSRVRENDIVQSALIGVNAAVVGAILGATVTLALESFVDSFTVALAAVTSVLFVRDVHAASLILGGGGVGMAWYFLVV
ncbi:chromate efflux transporter [Natronorubrum sulfidifaciens]|uniref:Chromate transport protein n=1 Tax=Natronorubrum sulfidifaciens JCM 14089 TaxID=1230460 RepID=L9WDU5_9EURY|nr:chromate efflux transporter [Natronorubrum sulfidifaciens]ELY47675.1 chromate transport protein [Natronorubrum sulfidifaciens JCM 14089]